MTSNKKITILADSSSQPRPDCGINIDDTYPVKLAKQEKIIVLDKSTISADTDYFLEPQPLAYDIHYAASQYFVINLGICDCSPRLFTQRQKKFIEYLCTFSRFQPKVYSYIQKRSKERTYHTKRRRVQNVTLDKFDHNLHSIINNVKETNPVEKVFIINIIEPSNALKEKSFGLGDLVKQYNQQIEQVSACYDNLVQVIDLNGLTRQFPEVVTEPDGHHFNVQGHDYIYNQIINGINA